MSHLLSTFERKQKNETHQVIFSLCKKIEITVRNNITAWIITFTKSSTLLNK